MLEPTWSQIVVTAVNSVVFLIIIIKLLDKLPTDNGHYPIEKVEWARGVDRRRKRNTFVEPDRKCGYEWFFEEAWGD